MKHMGNLFMRVAVYHIQIEYCPVNWGKVLYKPDNFLMSESGDVKLIDFALAVRVKKGLAPGQESSGICLSL